jgi:hypothetical protein
VAERRNLADVVKILERRGGRLFLRDSHEGLRLTRFRDAHAATVIGRSLPQLMLQCNIYLTGITHNLWRGGS